MEELIKVFDKTLSPSQKDQDEAREYIDNFIQRDLDGFLKLLSDILCQTANLPVIRLAAGLQLKNQLSAKDELLREKQIQNWQNLPQDSKTYIKQRVFSALGTEVLNPSSAPSCVAAIAIVELPNKQWTGLIDALVQNVTKPDSSDPLRLASLECIGYICSEIDQQCLEPNESNSILTAIVNGMQASNKEVRLAATKALLNSLEFTESNFQNEQERNYIMEVVCMATQSPDTEVAVAALECLVKIMSLYYQVMEQYMGPALFAITMQAMKNEDDNVALQGIEFWSNVCDEEIQLANEAIEAEEQGRLPEKRSKLYARAALEYLVPTLIETLTKQVENDDTDDWRPCKSAGVCLMLLANCTENSIVGYVLPYINQNIQSPDWKRRDAAIMTFGSILDGPDHATLQPIAEQVVPFLIQFMNDESVTVRDSAAWAIGKLCDTVPEAVLEQNFLPLLVQALVENLSNEPRVVLNVCWALNSLITSAGDLARETTKSNEHPKTFRLSDYYFQIIGQLLKATERQEGTSKDQEAHNLRSAAYEALMAAIKAAPEDMYHLVYPSTYKVLQERIVCLLNVLRTDNTPPEVRAQLYDMISLLWTAMQSLIKRMVEKDAIDSSDEMMQNMLLTMQTCSDSISVQEDILMASSCLLESVNEHFIRYIDALNPFLITCIRNHTAPQLNCTALGLLSDLARTIGKNLKNLPDYMNLLFTLLNDERYDKSSKAQILSIFADFALPLGPSFTEYIEPCMNVLHQASEIQIPDRNDYEMVDYCLRLREYTIEGYAGIINGLKDRQVSVPVMSRGILRPHVDKIVRFLLMVAADPDLTDSLLCACIGLVGDLAENLGNYDEVCKVLKTEQFFDLLRKGENSRYDNTRKTAIWAMKLVESLKS